MDKKKKKGSANADDDFPFLQVLHLYFQYEKFTLYLDIDFSFLFFFFNEQPFQFSSQKFSHEMGLIPLPFTAFSTSSERTKPIAKGWDWAFFSDL